MPNATVSAEPVHVELKTLEGGWVDIKQFAFGQTLSRREGLMEQTQHIDPKRKADDTIEVKIKMLQEKSTKYDFATCIVDHNLEDANGRKLDFANPMTLDALDTRIGTEIEYWIDKLNGTNFDPANFTMPSGDSTTQTSETSQKDTVST